MILRKGVSSREKAKRDWGKMQRVAHQGRPPLKLAVL
jgi:hypothetical protein